jgi:Phosphotransferase enzyme family
VIGTDRDADLLGYIPGVSGADGWAPAVTEDGVAAAARLLRSYHDAVRDWQPETEPVWFDGSVGMGGPGQVICHGDFGPWNIVSDGTTPVGLLDFEYGRPGDPLHDVAYACEYFVPFRDDGECLRWLRYPEPPDRRRRISTFAEAYGLDSAGGLVDRIIAVQSGMRDLVARPADEADRSLSGICAFLTGQQQDGHIDLRCLLWFQSGLGLTCYLARHCVRGGDARPGQEGANRRTAMSSSDISSTDRKSASTTPSRSPSASFLSIRLRTSAGRAWIDGSGTGDPS